MSYLGAADITVTALVARTEARRGSAKGGRKDWATRIRVRDPKDVLL